MRSLSLLIGVCLVGGIVAGGCAAPCGVFAPGIYGGLLPAGGPVIPGPCDPCDACECDDCDACAECGEACLPACCHTATCYPVPQWGPLTPLFAIFCWGYPETGCGDWYFGDWPMRPRGCEPCDQYGNWVGPWETAAHKEQAKLVGPTGLPLPTARDTVPSLGGCQTCSHRRAPVRAGNAMAASVSGGRSGRQAVQAPFERKGPGTSPLLSARPQAAGGSPRQSAACPNCGGTHPAAVAGRASGPSFPTVR